MEFSVFHFVPSASCISLGNAEKSLALSSLLCPHHIFICIDKMPLLQAAQSQRSQPLPILQILQALNHIHGSSLDSPQYNHVFLLNSEPKLNILLQVCLTSTEGRIASLKLSLMQPRRLLASLLQRHIAGSQSTWTLSSFPAGLINSTSNWSTSSRALALHGSVPASSFKLSLCIQWQHSKNSGSLLTDHKIKTQSPYSLLLKQLN